jgi:hypothetical protein
MRPFLFLTLFFIACFGFAQKRTIAVDDFSSFSLGIAGDAIVTQGNKNEIIIDCSDDVFEKIEVSQKGSSVTIKNKNNIGWNSSLRNVTVYVTMKDIESLSVSGSGSLTGDKELTTGNLNLAVSGSGNIDLDISSDDVNLRISGSGNIELEGNADSADASISGSGKIKAEDLTVEVFNASISGSGSCYITVTEELKARISGSGNIYYNGNPKRVDSRSSGSGKARKL